MGYLQVAKDQESAVPIGVYSDYALGKAAANAWMTNTGRAIRWEAQKLYESLETGEAGTEAVEETTFFTDDEDGE